MREGCTQSPGACGAPIAPDERCPPSGPGGPLVARGAMEVRLSVASKARRCVVERHL